jgi:hypothetical protein
MGLSMSVSFTLDLNLQPGSLTEVECSIQLTSFNWLVKISFFDIENIIYIFYKTSCLNEEINSTEPFLQLVFPAFRQGGSLHVWSTFWDSSVRLGSSLSRYRSNYDNKKIIAQTMASMQYMFKSMKT